MKLDPTVMRTMNRQDFRVLAAVETGMRTHALVPSPLVTNIANLRHGGANKIISSLLRDKLLSHDKSCGYDGYRLTNSGYDILALHNLKSRGIISALGDKIGTGKESDVYLAASPEGKQLVLKFHRLGRTSFRDVKKKRDYFMVNAISKSKRNGTTYKQQPNSWLFLSKISALKEFTFMKALHQNGYPTPNPITQNRHIVAMGLIRGAPLYQLHAKRISPSQAQSIFNQSIEIATNLVRNGLVHCDLNEFNLMVDLSGIQATINDNDDVGEHYVRHSGAASVVSKGALSVHSALQKHGKAMDGTGEIITEAPPEPKELLDSGEPKPIVTLIDFPQMVSVQHPNAKELWERDLECLKRFFTVKCKISLDDASDWSDFVPKWEDLLVNDVGNVSDGPLAGTILDDLEECEHGDDEDRSVATTQSMCLASKAQLRLDQELQASGFSEEDAGRDMELYYFQNQEKTLNQQIISIEEEEEGDKEGEDEGNSHGENDQVSQDIHDEEEYDGALSDIEDDVERENRKIHIYQNDINESVSVSNVGSSSKYYKKQQGEEASMTSYSTITHQTWAQAEEKAKIRVRQHLENQKKSRGRKNAFKNRNSNKTFVKGKRVFQDFGI